MLPVTDTSPLRAFFIRLRSNLPGLIAFNAIIWLGAGIVFGLVSGSSVIAGALSFVHMFLIMAGFSVLTFGWRNRKGSTIHCAACQYQRTPQANAATPSRCPECGANWNAMNGTICGETKRDPRLIVSGVILMLVGFGSIFGQFRFGHWQLQVLPTNALIHEVARAPRGFTRDEWIELNSRTLTPSQTLTLAEALLDKRLRKASFSADADNWLTAQIAADSLPKPLIERYYREALEIWIIAPKKVTLNESITLAIGTRLRFTASTNAKPVALIAGFFVGDELKQCCRQDQGIAGIMLGQQRLHVGGRDVGPGNGPTITIQPDRTGPLRVQLELWLAHLPAPGTVNPIVWQADGTPATPPGAVWMEHRKIEQVIEVVP